MTGIGKICYPADSMKFFREHSENRSKFFGKIKAYGRTAEGELLIIKKRINLKKVAL